MSLLNRVRGQEAPGQSQAPLTQRKTGLLSRIRGAEPSPQQRPVDPELPTLADRSENPAIQDRTTYNELLPELASAINRGVIDLANVPLEAINAIPYLLGSEKRIPTLKDSQAIQAATQGGFMEPGLARDVVQTAGEFAAPAALGGGAVRGVAKQVAQRAPGMAQRVASQFTGGTAATDVGLGLASGAGTELGGEVGETVGGETGRQVGEIAGGVAAPLAAIGVAQAAKAGVNALRNRLGPNQYLIDQQTGLPTKPFEKALAKRDLDFGAIVDDVDQLPTFTREQPLDDVVDDIIRAKLRAGAPDEAMHKYKLTDQGGIVKDDLGIEAVNQGIKEGDVASMKGANATTKKLMLKQLRIKRAIESDQIKGFDQRPAGIAGERVMARFNGIKSKAELLRKKLDKIAEREFSPRALERGESLGGLKGLRIDKSLVSDAYFDSLKKLRIPVDRDALPDPKKIDFSNSLISEDGKSQAIIKRLTRILSKGGDIDASDAHYVKRQIDTMLDFTKTPQSGLSDSGIKMAGKVRKAINETIRRSSPKYAEINDELSAAIKAMNDFDKGLGPSTKVGMEGIESAVGDRLRSLMSNNVKRQELANAVKNLDKQARSLGINFDDQVDRLVLFNQTLDDSFGATARTSLRGDFEAGIAGGVKGVALKKLAERFDKIYGVSDKKRFDVLQKILTRRD